MTIFRNKVNNKLYIIEHLIRDYKHLNRNAFAGIYAYPYKHKDDIIKCSDMNDVQNNFKIVSFT